MKAIKTEETSEAFVDQSHLTNSELPSSGMFHDGENKPSF